MKRENQLKQLPWLKEVSPETLDLLWNVGSLKKFQRGSILLYAREPVKSIFIQLSGKSMIYNLAHTGRRKIIFILGRGNLLNDHVLNVKYPSVFCETLEESQVFTIPASKFLQLMEQDFSLTKAVLSAQEKKLWRLGHQLKNTMGNIYLERKLAAKLWKLSRDFGIETEEGIEIDLNLPITLLADMLGTPRETTSRLCRTLVDEGLIEIRKKRIILPDPERMAEYYKAGGFVENDK